MMSAVLEFVIYLLFAALVPFLTSVYWTYIARNDPFAFNEWVLRGLAHLGLSFFVANTFAGFSGGLPMPYLEAILFQQLGLATAIGIWWFVLPARSRALQDKCPNPACRHELDDHVLVSDDPITGGIFFCPLDNCDCQGVWDVPQMRRYRN